MDNNQIEPNSFKYKEEKKRLEQVTTGKVTIRKRSGARRFADLFLAEDIGNVKEYIVFDLLIPAIKDMIVNMINNTTELLAYGRVRNGSKTQTKASSYISYNNYSSYSRPQQRPEPSRVGTSLDDIIFESRAEAELVLDNLRECIDLYDSVTVHDFLDAVGMSGDNKYTNYTQNNYGWTDLRDAYVTRVREGFLIVMPRVVQLTR